MMQEAPNDVAPIDLRAAWETLRKRKWVIAAVTIAVTCATLVYNLKQTPLYEASTSVLIEPYASRVLNNVEEVVQTGAGSYWSNADFYETEFQILKSRAIAERVAKQLGIEEDLSGRVVVTPIKNTKMVLIQYRDPDPTRAAVLANTHAEAYIEYNKEKKLRGTKKAGTWLGSQLGELEQKLEGSELGLYEFKQQNNILAQRIEDRSELLKKQITDYATSLKEIAQKRTALRARMDEIDRAKDDPLLREALPDVMQSAAVQNLSKLRLDLDTQLVQLAQRYGDKYPKYAETKGQREEIQKQLDREVSKIIAAIESEYRITLSTERATERDLAAASKEALELGRLGVQHDKLAREREYNTKVYSAVLGRLKETDLTQQLESDNVHIVDSALAPSAAVFPRTKSNVLLSTIAGLLLGLLVAFLLNLLDNSVKTQEDVHGLGVTFLGIIPRAIEAVTQPQRDLFVFEHQRSQVAECARAIRTALTFMGTDKPIKKLLVVSAKPMEGKTTNAIHLATTLALSGHKTLIVDTDLRRPRLHKAFGVSGEIGLSSALLGERSLDDVLKHTAVEGLDVLPCGPLPPSPAELLSTEAFKALVQKLEGRYDRIIFDSPPIIAVTDAPVLSSLMDGVVFVIKAGHTTKDLVRQSLRQLHAANANVLGAIMNDVDLTSRTYGYYYAYYRQYGSYAEMPKQLR